MTILELRRKRAALADQAGQLVPKDGVKMSSEARLKFSKIIDEVDRLKEDIDAAERSADPASRHAELDAELRQTTRPPEAGIGDQDAFDVARSSSEERSYSRSFSRWVRNGNFPSRGGRGISEEDRTALVQARERRDMGALGAGSAGAYFVPQGFEYQIEEALKYYGPMLDSSTIMDTATGQPLPWPTDNDTTIIGEQIDENTQVTANDVTLGQIMFNAWKYSSKLVKVSIELMQDSAFAMEPYIAKKFGQRIGRILNTKFTTGAGTTEPKGIVTCATLGATAVGAATNTGGSDSATNTIGTTDIYELEHSVDVAYRRAASFMLHDTTLKLIKQVLDKYGRPIWSAGLAAGSPDTIDGYPYWINNDMAVPAASAKSMLFGAMKNYAVRRVKGVAVLRLDERFADYGQVAFIGFARYDGNLLDAGTHPVKYLIQHS